MFQCQEVNNSTARGLHETVQNWNYHVHALYNTTKTRTESKIMIWVGGSKPLADTSSETTHLSKSCTYREERERDYSEKDWNMKKQKRSLPSLEFQTPLRIEQTLHQSAAIHLLLLLLSWYKQRRRGRGGNSMLGLKYCCKPVIHIVS